MVTEIRIADNQARICLPRSFANAPVIMEQISDSEVRVRRADAVPEGEERFLEEEPIILSDKERDAFLALLDNPPPPSEALVRAWKKYHKR